MPESTEKSDRSSAQIYRLVRTKKLINQANLRIGFFVFCGKKTGTQLPNLLPAAHLLKQAEVRPPCPDIAEMDF